VTTPTDPLPPLVTIDDPDYAKYKAGDEEYLLRVASAAIRDYCGWHISPSITETCIQLKLGSKGIVILPSRYVTDVSEVKIHNHDPDAEPVVLDANDYEWFEGGWIERIATQVWGYGWPGSYYGPDAPYYQPVHSNMLIDVTMTHGYETLPENLKQIAFELASMSATTAGLIPGVKTIQSPQYSTTFTDAVKAGMSFSPEHMNVLVDYRLGGWFA
jgi:hypothetical protein